MSIPKIFLNKNSNHRVLSGHPWIFDNEIENIPSDIEPGSEVEVYDAKNNFVGKGYFNPNSKIVIRIFTKDKSESLNFDFFYKNIIEAKNKREFFYKENEPKRIIFSEADNLPGLIADKYGDYIVLQILTLGMEKRKEIILEVLKDIYKPKGIYERSDTNIRRKEKLELKTGLLYGEFPDDFIEVEIDKLKILVNYKKGQKTGLYLDQTFNHRIFGKYAKNRKVLDLYSYNGLFGIYAKKENASYVICVDSSETALNEAKMNAEINNLKLEFLCLDSFDALRQFKKENEKFDLISIDPPPFAKDSKSIPKALKGYKDNNLYALKIISKYGILFTSCCSYNISLQLFIETLKEAIDNSKRSANLLGVYSQSPDHPVNLLIPETFYLKTLVFQVF